MTARLERGLVRVPSGGEADRTTDPAAPNRIIETGFFGDADGRLTAWNALAERLHAQASSSLAAGRTHSAGTLFLGASDADSRALAFSDGMTDGTVFAATFALHRQCFDGFVDASGGRFERLAIP